MAFYQLLFEECEEENLIKQGIDPTHGITSWGWFSLLQIISMWKR